MYLEDRKTALKRRCCRKNRFNDLKRYYAAMLAKFFNAEKALFILRCTQRFTEGGA